MSMKVFSKKYCISDSFSTNEGKIYKLYFQPNLIDKNQLLFETIEYTESIVEIPVGVNWDDLIDSYSIGFKVSDDVFILSFTENYIVYYSGVNSLLQPIFSIETDRFCQAIELIVNENNFECLTDNLIPIDLSNKEVESSESNELPSIIEYIQSHPTSFKTVYYPGAGDDFSVFQLFGKYANTEKIYYIDYFNVEPMLTIKSNLETRGENTKILSPRDFRKNQWKQLWPSQSDNWFGGTDWFNGDAMNPINSWGRKTTFKHPHTNQKCFDFYYLSTEAIKTMEVLIQNDIVPDVLVLQDHGFGGNWSTFGDESSPLYQVMQDNLPEYILIAPEGNTVLWPGYKQVTKTYSPKLNDANSMYSCRRELFKKVNN